MQLRKTVGAIGLGFAVLSACASARHEVLGPGAAAGTQNVLVTCKKPGACYKEAARACPYGFRVVDTQQEQSRVRLGSAHTHCTGSPDDVDCTTTPPPELSLYTGAILIECLTQEGFSERQTEQLYEASVVRSPKRSERGAVPRRCKTDADCHGGCCAQLEGLSARVCMPWAKCSVKLEEEPEPAATQTGEAQ